MKFNIYKNKVKVSEGNPNMLRTHTDEEIKEWYKSKGFEVEIERDK